MTWRKSSYSNGQADCVEIARIAEAVAVRDSKNTSGPMLFTSSGVTYARPCSKAQALAATVR